MATRTLEQTIKKLEARIENPPYGDLDCDILEYLKEYSSESERTAKVETYTDGQEELWSICECETDVRRSYNYCPKCGAKLEWSDDE